MTKTEAQLAASAFVRGIPDRLLLAIAAAARAEIQRRRRALDGIAS